MKHFLLGTGCGLVRKLKDAGRPLHQRMLRLEFVDWLASPEGPHSAALRCLMPRRSTWAAVWLRRLLLGQFDFPEPRPLCVPPTPLVKIAAIRRYARDYGLRAFVETGTFNGDTTAAVANIFAECFTIELSPTLHMRALERFAPTPNVRCLQGDSVAVLPDVIEQIKMPTLFWLDAHFSGGVTANAGHDPLLDELAAIYARGGGRDVVLIDDARGHDIAAIRRKVPSAITMTNRNDIIRLEPAR